MLPPIEDIAFSLRISEPEAQRLTEELTKRGLLDSDGQHLAPHNWHVRQFESDSSTERVKRFRNNSETFTETAPEAETDSETEQNQSRAETEASSPSRGKPRSVRAPVLPDEEWLDAMQKNPAYSMLNVRMLYLRMLEWCKERGKVPSRRRLINWMNNEDKPMTAKPSPPKGNGNVGKNQRLPDGITEQMLGKFSDAPDSHMFVSTPLTDAQMADFIDDLIAADDFEGIAEQYDLIVKRGGAKAEWEIRAVAYYELHKTEVL